MIRKPKLYNNKKVLEGVDDYSTITKPLSIVSYWVSPPFTFETFHEITPIVKIVFEYKNGKYSVTDCKR